MPPRKFAGSWKNESHPDTTPAVTLQLSLIGVDSSRPVWVKGSAYCIVYACEKKKLSGAVTTSQPMIV